MYCGHCGKEISENVDFCPYCGKLVKKGNEHPIPSRSKNKLNLSVAIIFALFCIFVIYFVFSYTPENNDRNVVDKEIPSSENDTCEIDTSEYIISQDTFPVEIQDEETPKHRPGDSYTVTQGNIVSTYTYQSDGSVRVYTVSPCVGCQGSGKCYGCIYNYMVNSIISMPRDCPLCGGSGVCKDCKGSRKSITVCYIQPNGDGYGFDNHMNTTISPGGHISGTNDATNDKSETQTTNEKHYIDQIKYDVPEYVDPGKKEWCEKCNEYTFKHRHERVRVP